MQEFIAYVSEIDERGVPKSNSRYKRMQWPALPRKGEMFDPMLGTYLKVVQVWHDGKHGHIQVEMQAESLDFRFLLDDPTWHATSASAASAPMIRRG